VVDNAEHPELLRDWRPRGHPSTRQRRTTSPSYSANRDDPPSPELAATNLTQGRLADATGDAATIHDVHPPGRRVGFQNPATGPDERFQAAASY
jgi:hypothetical protein